MTLDGARVGLFIDVENVLICAQNAGLPFNLNWIVDRTRQEGTIMSAKAYADWSSPTFRPVFSDFRSHAIELVQLATMIFNRNNEHKNTADIQLAVDALEMVLSPVRPSVVVIVGGDRDFVPLVQKLKRYGTRVVGIGVEGSVSSVLTQACDAFVYYDDLVPPSPEDSETPASAPDMTTAYSLLRRSAEALISEGRQPLGAAVLPMMRQLDPTFDLTRYRTTLKDLAVNAVEGGYIRLVDRPGSDFLVSVDVAETVPTVALPKPPPREYDFSTPEIALVSYRSILQEHRIPLLPWYQRWDLIRHLWRTLDEHGSQGMSMDEMRRETLEYARENGFNTAIQTIQKFLYSLNFSKCFSRSTDRRAGVTIKIPEEVDVSLFQACGEEEARRSLHHSYVTILWRERARLIPEAVFNLLHDSAVLDEPQQMKYHQEVEEMCNELQPPTTIGVAFQRASRQQT